jgi:hypothetical protein
MIQTDQISSIDQLGREAFAIEISRNVLNHIESSNESLVIGIHGAWGSGKSNLLHFVKENIKRAPLYLDTEKLNTNSKAGILERLGIKRQPKFSSKKLHLLEFNPWIFSGKEQLHYAFLNEFALKVKSKKHKLRKKIESLAKNLNWLGDIGGLGAAARSGASIFFEIPVDKLKLETNQILKEENIYAIIVLDDIDRLTPSEMLEVFQLVKLNANFSNTLFLISFDKKIVSEAITSNYQMDGNEYLEKIIQVDYSLPAIPSEGLEAMFFERLKILIPDESKFEPTLLHGTWLMYGLRRYFNNIRDLNRYFNSVSFRLTSISNDVNVHDFLLIEAIRLFDFTTYEIIRENYKEAIQFGSKTHHGKALQTIAEGPTKQLYDYLFGSYAKQNRLPVNDFRIYDPEYFDRYFTLTISKKDLREEEFNNFIHYPPNRLELLASTIRNKKIEFLLRRLTAKAPDIKGGELINAISPLISVWGEGFVEEFAEHWRSVWSSIKAIIKGSDDVNAGLQLLLREVSMSTSSFSPGRFVFLWLILQNIYREDDKNIDPDLTPHHELLSSQKEKLEMFFKHWMANYYSQFFYSSSFNELYQRIFFQSYARLLPEKYEEVVRQIMGDDEKIFSIINKLIFKDSETRRPMGINFQLLPVLIPPTFRRDFYSRLKQIKINTLPKENAETLKYFIEKLDAQLE